MDIVTLAGETAAIKNDDLRGNNMIVLTAQVCARFAFLVRFSALFAEWC